MIAPKGISFYLHKAGTKRRVHASVEAAEVEARRLAAANGETFVITQEVGRVPARRHVHATFDSMVADHSPPAATLEEPERSDG